MKKRNKNNKFVVVSTDKKGVFAGVLDPDDDHILRDAHMAVYWSAQTHGFGGLASIGPQPGSRISPPIPELRIVGEITAVATCTPEAEAAWRSCPWS